MQTRTAALLCVLLAVPLASCDTCDTQDFDPKFAGCKSLQGLTTQVASFLKNYNIPSMSLAYGSNGKLGFARTVGAANAEDGSKACTTSVYRIASISKPITATAIMKLVEAGKLKLDAKVFGAGAVLGTKYGTKKPYAKWVTDITVQQLLEHTAGGKIWGNDPVDYTFDFPELDASGLIGMYLDNYPPSEQPGSIYAYSNIGYTILGRIIEEITKQSYEKYVQSAIFAPVGATSLRVGADKLEDRFPNEVVYGAKGEQEASYSLPLARGDADGGWVANPSDLVRFGMGLTPQATKPLLKPETKAIMWAPSEQSENGGYAKGWSLDDDSNPWHQGNLDGTIAILQLKVSGADEGAVYAFLMNGAGKGSDAQLTDMYALGDKIIAAAKKCTA